MRYAEISSKLSDRLYFTTEDLQEQLGIKPGSARVLCTRYAKRGIFVRLKKNLYTLNERWNRLSNEDYLRISNLLQVPSYISLMTALCFYDITTQVQRDYFESVSLKRSAGFNIKGAAFNYHKLKKQYYFDFVKKGDIFVATKEKAFIDAVYLYSFGKYKLDFSSLDTDRLDKNRLKDLLRAYPGRTRDIALGLCRI